MEHKGRLIALPALLAMVACNVTIKEEDSSGNAANEAASTAQPPPAEDPRLTQVRNDARRELRDLRFLVDISDRKLRLMQGEREVGEHDVAVGSEEWPTPTGSWRIHRVDINPEWVPPPDEEWAKDEERAAPGAPDNPMGRARLVYRMPNTIHGTDETESLGKAVSHGSIRVANPVVLQLAEMLLKAGGAWEGPEWFRNMTENRSREFQVDLEEPVPIEVQE